MRRSVEPSPALSCTRQSDHSFSPDDVHFGAHSRFPVAKFETQDKRRVRAQTSAPAQRRNRDWALHIIVVTVVTGCGSIRTFCHKGERAKPVQICRARPGSSERTLVSARLSPAFVLAFVPCLFLASTLLPRQRYQKNAKIKKVGQRSLERILRASIAVPQLSVQLFNAFSFFFSWAGSSAPPRIFAP